MKINSRFLSAAVLAALPLLVLGSSWNTGKKTEVYAEELQKQPTGEATEQLPPEQTLEQLVEQSLAGTRSRGKNGADVCCAAGTVNRGRCGYCRRRNNAKRNQ